MWRNRIRFSHFAQLIKVSRLENISIERSTVHPLWPGLWWYIGFEMTPSLMVDGLNSDIWARGIVYRNSVQLIFQPFMPAKSANYRIWRFHCNFPSQMESHEMKHTYIYTNMLVSFLTKCTFDYNVWLKVEITDWNGQFVIIANYFFHQISISDF